jgi:hypothetical protein
MRILPDCHKFAAFDLAASPPHGMRGLIQKSPKEVLINEPERFKER